MVSKSIRFQEYIQDKACCKAESWKLQKIGSVCGDIFRRWVPNYKYDLNRRIDQFAYSCALKIRHRMNHSWIRKWTMSIKFQVRFHREQPGPGFPQGRVPVTLKQYKEQQHKKVS